MIPLPERLLIAAEILEGIGGQSALAATVREAATALQPSVGGEEGCRTPIAWAVETQHYGRGYSFSNEFIETFPNAPVSFGNLYLATPAQADGWPDGVLNRDDTLSLLTSHNAWRRGAEGPQTDPRRLGLALDAAIAYISAAPSAPRGLGG